MNKRQTQAHKQVAYALKTGKLTRPSKCDVCGQECKPEAHHDDYKRPLDVQWLCTVCHAETRSGGKHVSPKPYPVAIGAALASNNAEFIEMAVSHLIQVIDANNGNACQVARSLGVEHRTFMRWVGSNEALRGAVEAARAKANESQLVLC